ncbi:hypothetical protein PO124_06085 [Bacillus licheniformis]|nr:hypothetical protein [Bacillus licheniformis]
MQLDEISEEPLCPNQFVVMKDALGGSSSAVGIVDQSGKPLKACFDQEQVWGIRSRNVQQTMALELLLRQDIPLVTLIGKPAQENTACAGSRIAADRGSGEF